jgi:methylmalonyl-CoA decarboxylase subunit alpha
VMGAEAAVNAVYYNKLAAIEDPAERKQETLRLRAAYDADIDVLRLAGELVVDDVVQPEDLRDQLIRRFSAARGKDRSFSRRRHGVTPV